MTGSTTAFSIGHLARAAAARVETIRCYERIGLMPATARTAGNYRAYGREHVDRLSFVRRARALGFSIEQVRELLSLADDRSRPCDAVDELARTHLAAVERKLAECRIVHALSTQERVAGAEPHWQHCAR